MRKFGPSPYWVDFLIVAVATTAFFAVILYHERRPVASRSEDTIRAVSTLVMTPGVLDARFRSEPLPPPPPKFF